MNINKYIITALALFFIILYGSTLIFPAGSGDPLILASLIATIVICTGIIVENVKKEAKKIREMLQPPSDGDKT